MSAVHSALFAPDDLPANLLHASTLQPRGRHFLWFPIRLPQPVLHRGLRNDLFPRLGLDGAAVIPLKRGHKRGTFRRVRACEMCNWIDCDVAFSESAAVGEGSECSSTSGTPDTQPRMHPFSERRSCTRGPRPAPPQVPLQPRAQAQPPLPVQVISHHQKTANRIWHGVFPQSVPVSASSVCPDARRVIVLVRAIRWLPTTRDRDRKPRNGNSYDPNCTKARRAKVATGTPTPARPDTAPTGRARQARKGIL
jgi:hypothetical protein